MFQKRVEEISECFSDKPQLTHVTWHYIGNGDSAFVASKLYTGDQDTKKYLRL